MGIRLGGLLVALTLFVVGIQSTSADIGPPERTHAMALSPGADVGARGRTMVLAMILTCTEGANVNAYLQRQSGHSLVRGENSATDLACSGSVPTLPVTGRGGTVATRGSPAHHPPW
jgi:hypothetical protein